MSYETMCEKILKAISDEFPFELSFDMGYYTPENYWRSSRKDCILCEGTGKIDLKGEEYTCPRCHGKAKDYEFVAEGSHYRTADVILKSIFLGRDRCDVTFGNGYTSQRFVFNKGRDTEPGWQKTKEGISVDDEQISADRNVIKKVVREKNKPLDERFNQDKKAWEEKHGKV